MNSDPLLAVWGLSGSRFAQSRKSKGPCLPTADGERNLPPPKFLEGNAEEKVCFSLGTAIYEIKVIEIFALCRKGKIAYF